MAANKYSEIAIEVQNVFDVVSEKLEAAKAICDAVEILTALERAPEHQDTHPSHNIRTGGGYAHGLRVDESTMPILLGHVKTLVDISINDFDVMREQVITSLKEAHHG